MRNAEHISCYARGANIYGLYNATNRDSLKAASIALDIVECTLGHLGFHTPAVQLLKNQWNQFITTHGPEEKFLQICHSGGAGHVRNALLISPKSVRQRIIVLAIAPSVIIPNELCYSYKSDNYISRRDFVTYLDLMGNLKYGNQLHVLEPHPYQPIYEETYEEALQEVQSQKSCDNSS